MRDRDAAQFTARCHPGVHVNIPIAPAPGVNGLAPRLPSPTAAGGSASGWTANHSDLVTVVAQ